MRRRFTRRQQQQNAAFLKALARTGNARLAARELGVNRSTYTKRRAKCPAFAAEWTAALAAAHQKILPGTGRGTMRSMVEGSPGAERRAEGATLDLTPTRTPAGHLQLRRSPPGRITAAVERTFLAALESGATVRAAAAEAGFTHPSFHARANASPAFAREMRIARAIGRDRRLWAAMRRASRRAENYEIALFPIPRMTVEQAIHQLRLHRRSVERGFVAPGHRYIPKTLAEVAPGIMAKLAAVRRGMHYEKTGSWRMEGEGGAPETEEGIAPATAELGEDQRPPGRRA